MLRNLQITHCYHELATAIGSLSGSGANWCTFATWASKQAGQSIRQEDLMRGFERLFHAYHERQDLLDPPFTAEQVAALKAGRRPEGRL